MNRRINKMRGISLQNIQQQDQHSDKNNILTLAHPLAGPASWTGLKNGSGLTLMAAES
jgi:hypothetical protein